MIMIANTKSSPRLKRNRSYEIEERSIRTFNGNSFQERVDLVLYLSLDFGDAHLEDEHHLLIVENICLTQNQLLTVASALTRFGVDLSGQGESFLFTTKGRLEQALRELSDSTQSGNIAWCFTLSQNILNRFSALQPGGVAVTAKPPLVRARVVARNSHQSANSSFVGDDWDFFLIQ